MAFRTSKIRKIHRKFTIYISLVSSNTFTKFPSTLDLCHHRRKFWTDDASFGISQLNSTKYHHERRRRERKTLDIFTSKLRKYTVNLHFTFRWCNKYFNQISMRLVARALKLARKIVFISYAPANKNKTHRERRRRERKFGHFWGPKFVKYTVNSQATFRWSHQIVSPSFQAP